MLNVNENIERSIQPFMEFYDGTKVPFGKYNSDGEFCINYDTTSRFGYLAQPIYGVYIDKYKYKIFIGECPHKDENGVWITSESVPSFVLSSFGGAHYIEKEPDIPHIINIETDEWREECRRDFEQKLKSNESHDWELNKKLIYCSFKTYIKGLWNRIQKRFGRLSHYKGKHSNLLTWSKYPVQLQFVNHFESKSLYFVRENEDWIWFTYIKKNGKLKFCREKRENDHCSCEA